MKVQRGAIAGEKSKHYRRSTSAVRREKKPSGIQISFTKVRVKLVSESPDGPTEANSRHQNKNVNMTKEGD